MLFWFFVIIFVIGVAMMLVANVKTWNILRDIGMWTTKIMAFVLIIMMIILCCTFINVDARVERDKEIYNALKYKATSGACCDEYGFLREDVIDEVKEWNKYVRFRQIAQDDLWVGIFYPDVYDQLEVIDWEMCEINN